MSDWETFGPLLHGTARAWRLKLDERLRPMGLSQAKWRTLLHLSVASNALTQAEIAARLGVEEPSVVTLLYRLERDGHPITKRSAAHRQSPNEAYEAYARLKPKFSLVGLSALRPARRVCFVSDFSTQSQ